ncbi:MAG: DUF3810 domain-containing protein [Lachnospiraceae bacterium]|nr:DUF3810 domain-containing protein [Lachnospiraceae bacterium]
MSNFHITETKSHMRRIYLLALLLDLLALAANQLAARSSAFANAYSHYVYRVLSLGIGSVTGLLPFSVVELLLYATILFVLFDFVKQLRRAIRAAVARPLRRFLGHLFLILSTLLVLYVFLCGINYHRTSFSQEAGLSVTLDERGTVYDEADLIALCDYLVTEINATEAQLDVPFIGQTMETPKPSAAWLWLAGRTGQRAMEKLGQRYRRLSGHYPFPKPILNTWLLSVQQTTGVYSPFTVEANYNRNIAYYDIPFTICHELSHLRGYMQEEEANFIGVLATIGADDLYFNYSGYVSAWVYAGNALARIDSTAFATLYARINARTRQDMLYNNAYWKQFEGKPAEAHEQLNDAYLKIQGQATGVRSYGHVTDLMLEYFAKNGTLK